MPIPFADLEARVNRVVADRLTSAEMVFAAGSVAVLFGMAPEQRVPDQLGAHRTLKRWQASAPLADFAGVGVDRDVAVTVDGVGYVITEVTTSPADWMTLTLRRVG